MRSARLGREEAGVHQCKILIVDSDQVTVRMLENILDQAGYEHVFSAADADQALQLFRSAQPDLVVLDPAMPAHDGSAAVRELQSASAAASVPLLVRIETSAPTAKRRALEEGASDFLVVPLEEVEVLLRIRNLLQIRLHRVQLDQNSAQSRVVEGQMQGLAEHHLEQQQLLTTRFLSTLEEERRLQRRLTHRFICTLEEEKRAISFELHDGLTQYVMSSFAFFESYAASLKIPQTLLPSDLQKGLKYLQEAVIEARRMVNGMRSLALDELGLVGSLEQLLQEEQERAHWEEALLLAEGFIPRFDTVLETAAYRVVQEALTNVRKHAEAKRVTVRLRMIPPKPESPSCLQVEVQDWGRGFEAAENQEAFDHVGLHSMEERVNLMKGRILIESRPREGTRIWAEFPIQRRHGEF